MSGSQFQQFNEDLNKMLGSTQTVLITCPSKLKLIMCVPLWHLPPNEV